MIEVLPVSERKGGMEWMGMRGPLLALIAVSGCPFLGRRQHCRSNCGRGDRRHYQANLDCPAPNCLAALQD